MDNEIVNLNIEEVMRYMPHRYPFLLIDKVLEVIPGVSITALKNVSINEPQFTGHFPEKPVMPGVLLVEALAQAGGILSFVTEKQTPNAEPSFYLGGIDKTRFKRVVVPGDSVQLRVELIKQKQGIWKFSGKAIVDNEVACTAEITNVKRS